MGYISSSEFPDIFFNGKRPFPQNIHADIANIPILWSVEKVIAIFHICSCLRSINSHSKLLILGMWQASCNS